MVRDMWAVTCRVVGQVVSIPLKLHNASCLNLRNFGLVSWEFSTWVYLGILYYGIRLFDEWCFSYYLIPTYYNILCKSRGLFLLGIRATK